MISFSTFCLFLIFGLGLYYIIFPKRRYNLPPGTWNIFPRALQSHLIYQSWAKKYGHIFQTKYGIWDAVVIDDAKLIREAFSRSIITDRKPHKLFDVMGNGDGISFTNGQKWMEQRRFALRTLRDFGFGKQSIETIIQEEVNEFLKWMKTNEGIPTSVDRRLVMATVNSLWTLIAGERNDQDDAVLDEIMEKATDLFIETLSAGSTLMSYPQLIDILPKIFLKKWTSIQTRAKPFLQVFQDAIDKHIRNPAPDAQPRDLIDKYLTQIGRTTDPKSQFYGGNGQKALQAAVADLYTAGQATTSVTLTWAVLYLVRFPKIQIKLQTELDSIIGPNRLPTLADRPSLPFSQALIMEILRYSSIAPLGVFHEVTHNTTLGGYDIKKGTIIIPNLYSIHYSKEIWEDPEEFRPERFLSHDEQKIIKSENLIPFSVGKRQCLGESLAMDNIFLFLTNIFQRFQIKEDPANPKPTLESKTGFLREPFKFTIVMTDRTK